MVLCRRYSIPPKFIDWSIRIFIFGSLCCIIQTTGMASCDTVAPNGLHYKADDHAKLRWNRARGRVSTRQATHSSSHEWEQILWEVRTTSVAFSFTIFCRDRHKAESSCGRGIVDLACSIHRDIKHNTHYFTHASFRKIFITQYRILYDVLRNLVSTIHPLGF